MGTYHLLIGICWTILIVVWLISGVKSKQTVQKKTPRGEMWVRVALLIIFLLLLAFNSIFHLNDFYLFSTNATLQVSGVILCVLGIAYAIYARVALGSNWGTPGSLIEKPELIVTGPYKYVRHPIYSGMCLAMIGSMLSASLLWMMWLILAAAGLIFSAKKEEKDMLQQFPEDYIKYKKRTKKFIPFVW